MSGWIKIHRKVQDHWIWQDANKFQWWIKLLMLANYTDKKTLIGGELIECKRGQFITSLSGLSKHFGAGREATRNFLKMLEKEHMINTETNTRYTQITICKYEDYQDKEHTGNTPKTHAPDSRPDNRKHTHPTADPTQLKKDKEYKESKEGEKCKEHSPASEEISMSVGASKKKEKQEIPEIGEFVAYGLEKIPGVTPSNSAAWINSLKLKYGAWRENGWKNGNGKPIKNWKSNVNNIIQYLKPIHNATDTRQQRIDSVNQVGDLARQVLTARG